MSISELNQVQILEGIFSLIWIIIATIVGIRIIIKAFTKNRYELFSVGLFWIFICSPWYSSAITFLAYVFFNYTIDERTYLLIANVPIAPGLLCWIFSFVNILYKQKLKKRRLIILVIYIPICIIYEIFLIYFLFTDVGVVGTVEGLFNSRYNLFALTFDIFTLISVLITGLIFSIRSMRINNSEIQWKGRFLLVAFLFFSIGAFLDAAIPNIGITIVIGRTLLIISAIAYYLGFFLPDRFTKWLIKI